MATTNQLTLPKIQPQGSDAKPQNTGDLWFKRDRNVPCFVTPRMNYIWPALAVLAQSDTKRRRKKTPCQYHKKRHTKCPPYCPNLTAIKQILKTDADFELPPISDLFKIANMDPQSLSPVEKENINKAI